MKLILGDYVEELRRINDNTIDFILTDPPFNVGLDYKSIEDNLEDKEYSKWCYSWVKELYRVLKKEHYAIIFTGDKKSYWAEVKIKDLRNTMRYIYENQDEARIKGQNGLKTIYKWDYRQSALTIVDFIRKENLC